MIVCFPEGNDKRVISAAGQIASSGRFKSLLFVNDDLGKRKKDKIFSNIEYRGYNKDRSYANYWEAIDLLKNNKVQMLIAGAQITKVDLLHIIIYSYRHELSKPIKDQLFSIAHVNWNKGSTRKQFCIMDPSVVENPSARQLANMVKRALPIVQELTNTLPYACFLSYVTGKNTKKSTEKQRLAIDLLKDINASQICEIPLQLDAALRRDVREAKYGYVGREPNFLIAPDLLSGNLLYKSLEIFASDSIELSGALLCGLPTGVIGILPRSCSPKLIVNTINQLGIISDLKL